MDFNLHVWLAKTLDWLTTSGLRVVFLLGMTFVALKFARWFSSRIFKFTGRGRLDDEMQKRADTLISVIRYILDVTIIVVFSIMILGEFGVKIGPILAAAGVVGLAVGFGSQQLVQDVISGFFILLEDQVRVGDVVEIAGKSGLVEKVNLRLTVLRDLAGNVHFVRNGKIDFVTNMTKEYSRYVFDIGVAYREDVDTVMQVLAQIDVELREDEAFKEDILAPLEILGLDRFADSAVIIKARTTTKPIQQWRVAREFNRRLKKRFDELGIEIPFPHVTIYPGQNKDGSGPSLHITKG
ncbi:MAG: mechanosensitive ion channel family protein [Syntrophaceae bacterium]